MTYSVKQHRKTDRGKGIIKRQIVNIMNLPLLLPPAAFMVATVDLPLCSGAPALMSCPCLDVLAF